MSKIVNRVYNTYSQAVSVVEGLEVEGISHNDISIVANNVENADDPTHKDGTAKGAGSGAAAGAAVGGGAGLLAGLGMLAIPGVGPVVAAGWLVATAVGAVVGGSAGAAAGGLIGKLTEYEVSKEDANLYLEAIRRGGALVSVKTDEENRAKVGDIMSRHEFVDMTARNSAYREKEWTAFDPSAAAYTSDQIKADRALYR